MLFCLFVILYHSKGINETKLQHCVEIFRHECDVFVLKKIATVAVHGLGLGRN